MENKTEIIQTEVRNNSVKITKNSAGIHYEIKVHGFDNDALVNKLKDLQNKVEKYVEAIKNEGSGKDSKPKA